MTTGTAPVGFDRRAGQPLRFPDDEWTSPGGIVVAMDLIANLEQRRDLLIDCEADEAFRAVILAECRRSFVFWLSLFVETFVVEEITVDGRRVPRKGSTSIPMVPYPCQVRAAEELLDAREKGESVALQKSRDMGATWLIIAIFVWLALFHGQVLLVASRKEDLVESSENPDALFTKIDHIVEKLPWWMVPRLYRRSMHITFGEGASAGTIAGESTNDGLSVGGRKGGILLDEAARMEHLIAIDTGTQHSTPWRIFNSTIQTGHYFSDLCTSGRCRVVTLAWWDHPEKGRDRELVINEKGEQVFTSSYYRVECAKSTKQQIATELDMDHQGGGSLVFDMASITRQISIYGCDPSYRGEIMLGEAPDRDLTPRYWPYKSTRLVVGAGAARFWWWGGLLEDEDGRWRPDQGKDFGIGVDIADGVGATPSVISIGEVDTGYKCGRWLCRATTPGELSMTLMLVAHWLGGRRKVPVLCIEANGGRGQLVISNLITWKYPRIYRHEEKTKKAASKSLTYGWSSTTERRKLQIEEYSQALKQGKVQDPDIEALESARKWVYYPDGRGVGLPQFKDSNPTELAEHGDITISEMLMHLACVNAPRIAVDEPEIPYGSVAWARQNMRAKIRAPWETA